MSIAAGGSSAMQEQIRQAAEAAQRAKEEKAKTGRRNKTYSEVKKDMDQKKRQKEKVRLIIQFKFPRYVSSFHDNFKFFHLGKSRKPNEIT